MGKDNKKRSRPNFGDISPRYSFLRGWNDLKLRDVNAAKEDIMSALGIKSNATFYRRLRGQIVPTIEEYDGIIEIFKKYGVKQPFGVN